MGFPADFIWGAASASYQIEGGAAEDGKGPSIWDTFSRTPGKTFDGDTGDTACDAYHRFEEDLDLMASLGIRHYRFSISWPRVFPQGTGEPNEAGLKYYEAVTDACLARGIKPWITLYHWDLPQALEDKGGWESRETALAFAQYAGTVARRLGRRADRYFTLNEPQCVVGLGYISGSHAPGKRIGPERAFACWHHLLLAHGLASAEIRKANPAAGIGVASTGALCYLDHHQDEIPQALKDAVFYTNPAAVGEGSEEFGWSFTHQWFLDPVCTGAYPEDPASPWYALSKEVSPEDMRIIGQRPDLIGLNIYNGHEVEIRDGVVSSVRKYPGYPRTALKWPVTPPVLYWGPRLIHDRYGLPVVISENGLSCNDIIFLDGKVHDPEREDFLHRYLLELKAAAKQMPLAGYFHWSLTDNFEWNQGYRERFGLIYVDYRTQRRIVKDSARWYASVIASNGENL